MHARLSEKLLHGQRGHVFLGVLGGGLLCGPCLDNSSKLAILHTTDTPSPPRGGNMLVGGVLLNNVSEQ